MEGLQEVTNALSNDTIPDPLHFSILENPIAIVSGTAERVKLRTSNLARTFTGAHPKKTRLKILEKREHGRIQGLKVLGIPIISGAGKAMNFRFCTHIHRLN